MARWHDPEAPACSCLDCTEARYHAALAEREAEIDAEDRALADRIESELSQLSRLRQLRLPMAPLPHVAHHPARLQRGPSVPCQPELI